MVRHSDYRWTVAVLALTWAGTVAADPMKPEPMRSASGTAVSPLFQSGDVEKDFKASSPSVTVVPGQSLDAVAQPKWMTDAGLTNGYVMKDIRLSYDKNSDTLAVGVNFWGIAGNTDGSPDGKANPRTIAMGGSNPPHIGGDKSISVAFAPVTPSGAAAEPLVVAGVPAIKMGSPIGSLDGFNVAAYQNSPGGLGRSYGATLANNLGSLAYDPSSVHPDFEFTIKNFSKIPGLDALSKGFYIQGYAGTGSTTVVGKSAIFNTLVGAPLQQPQDLKFQPGITPPAPHEIITPKVTTPEPTTFLAWGLIAGGAAWRVRRRVRPTVRP
jgi:hypothetical protein